MENNDDKLLSEYLSDDKSNKFRKGLKKFLNKVLISLVLLIGSLIFVKTSPENKDNFKKVIFNETFKFSRFNNFYEKYFGSFNIKKEIPVVSEKIDYTNGEKFLNGIKVKINDGIVSSISSGIVVFKGGKDEIENLVIVQSSDGFDIWYGLLENINVSIYDYINEGALIGSADKVFYLAITKDNKFYSYDEYKEIKNQS